MQAQTAWADLVQGTSAKPLWINRCAGILEQHFQPACGLRIAAAPESPADDRDRLTCAPPVGVANHVGHRLVDLAHNGARIGFLELHELRRAFQCRPHKTKRFRIAFELQT